MGILLSFKQFFRWNIFLSGMTHFTSPCPSIYQWPSFLWKPLVHNSFRKVRKTCFDSLFPPFGCGKSAIALLQFMSWCPPLLRSVRNRHRIQEVIPKPCRGEIQRLKERDEKVLTAVINTREKEIGWRCRGIDRHLSFNWTNKNSSVAIMRLAGAAGPGGSLQDVTPR